MIAHESDLTMGLANKLTAKYCEKILTSFPETAKTVKNGEYVGAPIRKSIFSADKAESLKAFGFSGKKPIILVTGGSLGAQALNKAIRDSLPQLIAKYDVIHICGENNLAETLNIKGYYQVEFLNKIENAFSCASVCVTRAGSNTLFELMSLKIPCVLIPLPKGNSRGDQVLNAAYFQKRGLASVLPQENLTCDSLTLAINSIYTNRANIAQNFEKYQINDASRQISRILADYID